MEATLWGVASFLSTRLTPSLAPMLQNLMACLVLVSGSAEPFNRGVQAGPALQERAVLDSVRMDMARGRDWHAVRRLHSAFPDGPGGDEELVLLFARAEAGWGNWDQVRVLLADPLATGEVGDQEAWYLLGRALEVEERWEEAERAYSRVLGAEESALRPEAQARRARIRGNMGSFPLALVDVEEMQAGDPTVAGWVALELAERAALAGSREETRQALSSVRIQEVRNLGWNLLPQALLVAGDSIGAEAAYWSALPSLPSAPEKAAAWDRVGVLRLARGDSVGAQGAFHQVLALSPSGVEALRASEALMRLGIDSAGVALAGARALADAGRHVEALEAYVVYEGLLGGSPPASVVLAKARSHLSLGQGGVSLALAAELGESGNPSVAAPALVLQAQALRQAGRGGEASRIEDKLIDRFPGRPEAVDVLFSRAGAMEARGDREGAIRGYRETVEMDPSQDLAGQARMRTGQILLGMGRAPEALEVYSTYLTEFPAGRRWDEAAFWAGRLLFSLDRDREGRELLSRLRRELPLSYYSVRAGELLGAPYDPPIPSLTDSLPFPIFLQEGLVTFDRLRQAGLPQGAAWEADVLAAQLRMEEDILSRQGGLLRLAKELNSRGFTREGINLGWELRREGRPWDRELLAAVYPFPYQEIVVAEAGERGLDPFLMAGLIRQESAFWAEARSRADARGLMQVLPATGRELARASGPEGFEADSHLYEAEINIHLGMLFFADMRRRFGEDLPIILSAYNAGPTRALRWREFPEVADMALFVERIPFVETRGYVKNVLVNREVYRWLYGLDSVDPGTSGERSPFLP